MAVRAPAIAVTVRQWQRIYAAVHPETGYHVDPGALGEYAVYLCQWGQALAAEAFPEVAAHLIAGCKPCSADLTELTVFGGFGQVNGEVSSRESGAARSQDGPTMSAPYPSVEEAVDQMLTLGVIDQENAQRYLANYSYFEQNRPRIYALYDRQWVASLNERIYHADAREALYGIIAEQPNANRAYVERVGTSNWR